MSDARRPILTSVTDAPAAVRVKPRLKRLRLLALLIPLALLAVVSTVFGMMMAVASDLPALENAPQYRGKGGENSILYDVQGNVIGRLASDQHRLFVEYDDISSFMRSAIVSIEDQRYFTNSGVDLRGIARAFTADVLKGSAVQGGSTITQQFVKNALQAQDKRTVFQKLRESALAYHLTRKWSKQKILTEYLNSIYFGNGAYGIEAAAETYFGQAPNHLARPGHPACGTVAHPCAKELLPQEAALLAAVVASPSAYDPVAHPVAALARRNLVLRKMRDQHAIPLLQYTRAVAARLPAAARIRPPQVDSKAPYFTTWVRQQLVDKYGARKAFEGGLKVRTTLDLKLQEYAENAVKNWLGNRTDGPTAALVAIDNDSGEVRAMVSGSQGYGERPFNLATQGQRQPGSAFKPFILAQALRENISPDSVWASKKQTFCVVPTKHGCKEPFVVNNFEDTYVGQRTLTNALTYSDNSVFAQVGIKVGTKKVASLAQRMGIRTPVSHNLAMTLGGLKQGVTPLDMAHAFETFATGGRRIYGTLGAADEGPVGVRYIDKGDKRTENKVRYRTVLSQAVADSATQAMATVISQGTARRAQVGTFAAGKTGTTEDYGDAWFVGFTDKLTVAVWVGYPDKLVSMRTDFEGGPVEGGTYPALIWHDFMAPSLDYFATQAAKDRERRGLPPKTDTTTDTSATEPTTPSDTSTAPAEGGNRTDAAPAAGGKGNQAPPGQKPPATPTPAPASPTPPPVAPSATDPSGGASPPPG